MRRNGFDVARQPILRPLDTIECRDAILNADGTAADWPEAGFIVGNPPFLGGKLMRWGLGDDDVETLFHRYWRRVPPEADLVTYWFEKAHTQVESGQTKRVGLVATNSIRGGANRRVLDQIASESGIFEAWSDEPWVIEGASVRVSLICYQGRCIRRTRRTCPRVASASDESKRQDEYSSLAPLAQWTGHHSPFG